MNAKQQRIQLEGWLREYTLWNRLGSGAWADADGADLPGGLDADGVDFAKEPEPEPEPDPEPRSGQIRLWPAVDLEAMPFYGLVLQYGYGSWRVVPFSPLALPAVPGEMRVQKEPPVQVVQGWNQRVVASREVKNSWCAGRLSDADLFNVERFLAVVNGGSDCGGELPAFLSDQVGPPLQHPLDPRYEYLDDERERVSAVLGAGSFLGGEEGNPLSKAAEPEGPYDAGAYDV